MSKLVTFLDNSPAPMIIVENAASNAELRAAIEADGVSYHSFGDKDIGCEHLVLNSCEPTYLLENDIGLTQIRTLEKAFGMPAYWYTPEQVLEIINA